MNRFASKEVRIIPFCLYSIHLIPILNHCTKKADFRKESMNTQMFNNYSSASIINQVHQEENLSAGAFRQTGEERSLHCQVFVFFKKIFLVLISMIFIISTIIFSITTNSIMIILITMLLKNIIVSIFQHFDPDSLDLRGLQQHSMLLQHHGTHVRLLRYLKHPKNIRKNL